MGPEGVFQHGGELHLLHQGPEERQIVDTVGLNFGYNVHTE
jgi:hypothetical protein